MITISHAQARRLLQAQLDQRQLPEAQWAALEAHLETCAECQAYRDRLALTERGLRQALRLRWDPVNGPGEGMAGGLAPALAALYRERKAIRRLGLWMVGGAALFLLCAVWFVAWSAGIFSDQRAAPVPTGTPILATMTPLPTPTRPASRYQGVIAYEYRAGADGSDGEIYLLNAGAEPVNLTNDPADDRSPAWSPDGQWLAFLSDRTGKDEVFVMHISGTRLTRLTDLPAVAWRGLLSWSADGQMLALVGERKMDETGSLWIYLVPLDGSNAYPLGYSAGAIRAAFSPKPQTRLLAFSGGSDWDGGLIIYDLGTEPESALKVDRLHPSPETGSQQTNNSIDLFDWSADGRRLLFRQNFADPSQPNGGIIKEVDLRMVDTGEQPVLGSFSSRLLIGSAPAGDFAALSWTGVQNEIAYLVDAPGAQAEPGCQIIRIRATMPGNTNPREVSGLCVEDGLERANWRVKEKSLLVTGREPDRSGERGLYVVSFQGAKPRLEWLADARKIAGSPRLRPGTSLLAIDPRPVRMVAPPPRSPLPGAETGDLLVISSLNERTLINRLAPDSRQRITINQSTGQNFCPTWSPDHARIAFFSNRASENKSISEVFVIDGSGLNARQLTESLYHNYFYGGCPTWSPDGRWLMAVGRLEQRLLAFIPTGEKNTGPHYLRHNRSLGFNQMAWLPDGRLLVAYSDTVRILLNTYDPNHLPEEVGYFDPPRSADWTKTSAIAVSPDGRTLALGVVRDDQIGDITYGLLTMPLEGANLNQPGELSFSFRYDLPGALMNDSLHWLPGGRLAYILRYPAGSPVKAKVFAIHPQGNASPEQLASFSDPLLASAWSADGRWLTAITGAGRYVLDLSLAPGVSPAWVDGETGLDVDW